MNVLDCLLDVLPKAAAVVAAATNKLAEMRSELDKVLAENNDKQYTDQLLTRLQLGEISLPKALKEAKITLETKKRTAQTRQSDEKTDANIPSNNSTPEYYRGSDGAYDGSYGNLQDSNTSDPYGKGGPQSSWEPENKNVGSAPAEVYQGSDWEWQLEQFNMDRSDDRRTYENDNLNRNDTSGFSTNSVQTDGELDKNWPENTATSDSFDENATNYDQNNNPPPWENSSNDPHRNSGLAGDSDASGQGPAASKYRSIQTNTTDNDQDVKSDPNEPSDRNNNADKRNSSVLRTRSAVSPRARRGDNEFSNSDGEVISQRKKRLQQEFTQDQQLGTNSRNNTVGPRSDLNNFDTSDGFSPLNSDNQNVNSEYDTNYNTSDIEYSEYSPLNTDDQQDTFNSTGSTAVSPSAAQDNNTVLKDSSTQTNETNYSNDVEDSTSYNDYSPLNGDNQNMSTYPDAHFQNQSSDSDSEDLDDEVNSDSATWNQSDEIHAETLISSQQKSHSPNKNNNFSNSAHGSAAPTVPRHSAHSAPVERNSDGIKYMERFDNNNFTSSDDSSATQKSNTDLEQTNHKSMRSEATQTNPSDFTEQSGDYNLNSAANEHSSNQSETNQRLDQSHSSASNRPTATSRPSNPSNRTQQNDFQNPDESSLSHPSSFDSSINQSSSASSDVPTEEPRIHPLDVLYNTLKKRVKDMDDKITAKALFKKYKMGGKFVRNMLRAFPYLLEDPEIRPYIQNLFDFLYSHQDDLTASQTIMLNFLLRRGFRPSNSNLKHSEPDPEPEAELLQ